MTINIHVHVQKRTKRTLTFKDSTRHKYWNIPLISQFSLTVEIRKLVVCEWDKLTPGREVTLTFDIVHRKISANDFLQLSYEDLKAEMERMESENTNAKFCIESIDVVQHIWSAENTSLRNKAWIDHKVIFLRLKGRKRNAFHALISDDDVKQLTQDPSKTPFLVLRSIQWHETNTEIYARMEAQGYIFDKDNHKWIKPTHLNTTESTHT